MSDKSIDFSRLPEVLEATVDRYSLSEILAILADIAHDKAEHIEVNWQDLATAEEWIKANNKISEIINEINV